jgi:hypothetical protein
MMRVEFLSELDVRVVHGGWVLLAPFESKVYYHDTTEWITVPAGFMTDGASVPRLPMAYMLFGGRARKAATIHDWLYERRRNRAFADAVFLAAMENEESAFVRGFMHAGVRLGGWTRYQEIKEWHDPYELPPSV